MRKTIVIEANDIAVDFRMKAAALHALELDHRARDDVSPQNAKMYEE